MDMENNIVELDNQDKNTAINPNADEDLRGAIEETLSKIRRQSMLLGAQTMCRVVLDKILVFERKPGSKSNNDHKRLIKEIKNFCEVGLSRKVNADGETEPVE